MSKRLKAIIVASGLGLFLPFNSGCGGGTPKDTPNVVADRLAAIEGQISELTKQVGNLAKKETGAEDLGSPSAPPADVHSVSDAKKEWETLGKEPTADQEPLGKEPTADQMASCLAMLDDWTVRPEEESGFRTLKLGLASTLRKKVAEEVRVLQSEALNCDSSREGAEKHAGAGRILSLYPMADDPQVTAEAKLLSAQQAEIAARLEALRRQRYNNWAAVRIGAAIDAYNDIASSIPYKSDTTKLVESLAGNLGPVDPALLEPAVLDLYNYALENTKAKIYEKEKTELAKKLTDPSVKRKILGDF